MNKQNFLKAILRKNQLTIGSWITLAHPAIAEIMAKSGFDWLAIDLEHSTITVREAEELIRVVDLCGVTPLVRLSIDDPVLVKRVMDAGAHGIIVPMINSKADAERAVSLVYYPPKGNRGVGLARAQGYGARFNDYWQWLDRQAVVIVQVEGSDSVKNIESILSVDGVDGYIVGPYDLSASLRVSGKFSHPKMVSAMEKIYKIGRAMQKPGGLHIIEPDPKKLRRHIDEGFRLLAYSLDIRMLDVSCRQGLAEIRESGRKV
ncbi:MAG: 2,4-dihydroxyhept-2-ene-1,7-dioic acid aldolase [Elusimicrobia bacterium]|nr:2,4-dihydroxyhept-2-ene-1,7-dioic acid aldolase [Elusimicrobiota bacterium]